MQTTATDVADTLHNQKAQAALSLLEAAARGTHQFSDAPAGWVPSRALHDVAGWRYSARIYDLRQAGHDIESRRESQQVWIYRLRSGGEHARA